MRETLEAWGGLMIVLTLIGLLLSCLLLWFADKLTGIKSAMFKKILPVAAAVSILIYGATLLFLLLPGPGAVYGFALGILLTLFLIKGLFRVHWTRAIVLWIFVVAAQAATVIIGAVFFVGGVSDLISIL